jgi:hypothetical protein
VDGAILLWHLALRKLRCREYKGTKSLVDWAQIKYPKYDDLSIRVDDLGYEVLIDNAEFRLSTYSSTEETTTMSNESSKDTQSTTTKKTFHQLKHLACAITAILEQMIDHQADLPARTAPNEVLEGYEFMDIVEPAGPIRPKKHRIQGMKDGWATFVKAIDAVVIFGQDFGELVQAASVSTASCPRWRTMPHGEQLLAAPLARLQYIAARKGGNLKAEPLKLTHDTYWYQPVESFDVCICDGQQVCQRIQQLDSRLMSCVKRLMKKKKKKQSPCLNFKDVYSRGWVLFGKESIQLPRPSDDSEDEMTGTEQLNDTMIRAGMNEIQVIDSSSSTSQPAEETSTTSVGQSMSSNTTPENSGTSHRITDRFTNFVFRSTKSKGKEKAESTVDVDSYLKDDVALHTLGKRPMSKISEPGSDTELPAKRARLIR